MSPRRSSQMREGASRGAKEIGGLIRGRAAAATHGHLLKEKLKTEMDLVCRTESEVKGERPNAGVVGQMKVTTDNGQLSSTEEKTARN